MKWLEDLPATYAKALVQRLEALDGTIFEIIVCLAALTPAQIANVINELQAEYGP